MPSMAISLYNFVSSETTIANQSTSQAIVLYHIESPPSEDFVLYHIESPPASELALYHIESPWL